MKLFTEETSTSPLAGYTYVVTGSLSKFTRTEIREFISSKGGKVSSSISAKTDFLVAGENSGSKLDKAQKLGVKIITEAQLLQMCDEDTDLQNDEHDGKEDKTGMLF